MVIGGGNVAYDVARSAVRPSMPSTSETIAEMERGEQVAYDVARSALRMSGDKEVHVVCLESRAEMPADEIEVDRRRGRRHPPAQLARPARDSRHRTARSPALRTVQCTAVFDANGRFNPSIRRERRRRHPRRHHHLRHRPDIRSVVPATRTTAWRPSAA